MNLEKIKEALKTEDINELKNILKLDGQTINTNDRVVIGISKGLIRNEGECPCFQDVPIEDKICPCKALRETNFCKCNLYIKTA